MKYLREDSYKSLTIMFPFTPNGRTTVTRARAVSAVLLVVKNISLTRELIRTGR